MTVAERLALRGRRFQRCDRSPMSVSEERPFRVLVVDDNQDAARILGLLLRKSGHEVLTAYSGVEALKVADDFQPQCIVSDIGMPGLDGYELARRFRSNPRFKDTPLIALTAYTDSDEVRGAGFNHHLVKPVNMLTIVPLIAEVRALQSEVARMRVVAETQATAMGTLKDMLLDVKDDVENLKTSLKEDVADLKSELKDEVQELKQELREAQDEVREIKAELKQAQE